MSKKGWKIEHVSQVPPKRDSFMKGFKSVRWHMDIQAFGVNAITANKGGWLAYEHDESKSNQDELFVIMEGEAEFILNGEAAVVPQGSLVAVKPAVTRSAKALKSPTTMLIVGAPIGKAYEPVDWA